VAIGRSAHDPAAVFESKYVTYASLTPMAVYLIAVAQAAAIRRRGAAVFFGGVVAVGLVAANVYGFAGAGAWQQERRQARYLLQTIDRQPDARLATIYDPRQLRVAAHYLASKRFGPFRHSVDALMPVAAVPPDGARPTRTIGTTAAIQQQLICPVDVLDDISVAVSRSVDAPAGTIAIVLSVAGRRVAERSIESNTLPGSGWLTLRLETPVRPCRGETMLFELSGPDEARVHAWTHPPYYAGVLRQADHVEQRNLGLAFNSMRAGLRPDWP
jgi:hypothetical protein